MFKKPVFVILIMSLILVALWFRDGNIMATGESGVPFYDPTIQFNINKDAWAQYTLGHPINIGIAAKPTYWLMALLQSIAIPLFLIQACFIWVNLIIAGLSIYYLTKEFFPKLDQKIYLLAPLFSFLCIFTISFASFHKGDKNKKVLLCIFVRVSISNIFLCTNFYCI